MFCGFIVSPSCGPIAAASQNAAVVHFPQDHSLLFPPYGCQNKNGNIYQQDCVDWMETFVKGQIELVPMLFIRLKGCENYLPLGVSPYF